MTEKHLDGSYDPEAFTTKDVTHRGSDVASEEAILTEFSKEDEKRIMHRVDRRLVLTVGFMYD
jgi:hypothetical protein